MLKITKTELGEYGYSNTYELLDKAGNTLKERSFDFGKNTPARRCSISTS